MQHIRSKIANFSWLSAEQGIRLVVGLITTTLVARRLGADGYAAFAYVFGVAAIAVPLGRFGLDAIILRRVSAAPENARLTVSSAAILSLMASMAGAGLAIAIVAASGGPPGVSWELMAFAALTIVGVPGEIPSLYLKAKEQVGLISAIRTAIAVIIGAVICIAALSDASLETLVLLRGAEAVFLALAGAAAVWMVKPQSRLMVPSAASIAGMAKAGLPLMIAGLATVAYMRIDQIMLGHMAPAAELGVYSIAVRISEVSNLLPFVLQSTLYAAIVRNYVRDPLSFDQYMQRIYDLFALAAWPTMFAIGLGTYFLLVPVFGPEYAGALPMVLLLLLGLPLFFLYYAWGTMLTVREWMWTAPLVAGFGAMVNIALNFALISPFGGSGAAAATTISYAAASIGGSLFIPKLRGTAAGMIRALDPFHASKRLLAIYRQ